MRKRQPGRESQAIQTDCRNTLNRVRAGQTAALFRKRNRKPRGIQRGPGGSFHAYRRDLSAPEAGILQDVGGGCSTALNLPTQCSSGVREVDIQVVDARRQRPPKCVLITEWRVHHRAETHIERLLQP